MTCKNNIVECLRNKGIWPDAFSSSIYLNEERYNPKNVINYSSPSPGYFGSDNKNDEEWWCIDFQTYVKIKSYKIKAYSECNYIYRWNIKVSLDGDNWIFINNQTGYPGDSVFEITPYPIRFFKITGDNAICSSNGYLAFLKIYFFGDIFGVEHSCKIKSTTNLLIFTIFLQSTS